MGTTALLLLSVTNMPRSITSMASSHDDLPKESNRDSRDADIGTVAEEPHTSGVGVTKAMIETVSKATRVVEQQYPRLGHSTVRACHIERAYKTQDYWEVKLSEEHDTFTLKKHHIPSFRLAHLYHRFTSPEDMETLIKARGGSIACTAGLYPDITPNNLRDTTMWIEITSHKTPYEEVVLGIPPFSYKIKIYCDDYLLVKVRVPRNVRRGVSLSCTPG